MPARSFTDGLRPPPALLVRRMAFRRTDRIPGRNVGSVIGQTCLNIVS
jgi:hypothetical protein